ncbi:hypothetical protein C8Q77DRAFT_1157890 [Trametes polyzona]|nr:hypothetical protein C8Q77DRAFT_1157890 [Trametes polyzona]
MSEDDYTLFIAIPDSPIYSIALLSYAVAFIVSTVIMRKHIHSLRESQTDGAQAENHRLSTKPSRNLSKLEVPRGAVPAPPLAEEPQTHSDPTPAAAPHPSTTGRPFNHALRRTKSFSAQVLTNSTRPIVNAQRVIKDQVTSIGREMLRPMRAARGAAEPPILEDSESSREGETPSPGESPSETEQRRSEDSTDTAVSSSSASVDHTSPEEDGETTAVSSSGTSTPEGPRPDSASRDTLDNELESSRDTHPPRSENDQSGAIVETRSQSPFKTMFRVKPKGGAGSRTPKGTTQKTSSFALVKSTPSLRRLFCPSGSSSAGDVSSEGEGSSSDSSRRSSVSSETSEPPASTLNPTNVSTAVSVAARRANARRPLDVKLLRAKLAEVVA